jgi:hypothetical protein
MRTSGIESEPTATGERFVLPERNVPHRRGIGLAITGGASFIALLGTGFGVTWILMAFPTTRGGPPSPLGYAVAAIGLVPIVLSLAVGWKFARLGLLIAFGRAEVRVERGTIIATDRFGPVAWTRRIARSEIERFEIRSKLTDERGGPDSTTANGPWRDTLVLVARRAQPEGRGRRRERPRKQTVPIAIGFEQAVLADLADRLGEASPADAARYRPDGPAAKPAVFVIDDGDEESLAVSPPPDGAEIDHEPTADGLTVTFRPRGWRGTKGIATFAVIWIGFLVIWTGGASVAAISSIVQGTFSPMMLAFPLFSIPFWAVGVFLIQDARSRAMRKTILDVIGDTLLISEERLRGVRTLSLEAHGIREIKLGPSGTEVNDRPLNELQIHLVGRLDADDRRGCPGAIRNGATVIGMLQERDDDAIRWTAAVLRKALLADDARARPGP